MMNRSLIALGVTSAAIVVVAAGALGYALRPVSAPSDLAAGSGPRTAPASSGEFVDERSIQVRLNVGEPTQLTSSATGTLTATGCSPGTEVTSGTIVATVNYEPIFAIHTQSPLYRDLSVGQDGEDVRVLQRELSRLGFTVEESGYFGWDTARAVRDLRLAAGAADNDAAYRLGVDEIVWLSGESLPVNECPATVGQPVGPGTPLGTGPGTIQSVVVEPLPTDLTDGERVLTVLGVNGTVGSDGVSVDPQLLEGIRQAPEAASVIADPASATLPARIQLVAPIAVLKVPPAAVFGIDTDRGCIQSNDTKYAVTIIGASLGSSLVALDEGASVTSIDLGTAITGARCDASEQGDQP